MIGKEDFVTFEVAKMLHDKGYSGMITCTTLYEAARWLRSKKIYVSALPTKDNGVTCWYYQVVNDNDPDATYAEHMGNDIEALLCCDAVLFLDGWRTSKGCRLEHEAANIYDKETFYSLDRIPNTDITPPDDCPYHVKDFKECKYQCETIRPDGNRKINCTCDYFTKNMLIEFGNFKIK